MCQERDSCKNPHDSIAMEVLHALFFFFAPPCSWTPARLFHRTSLQEPSRHHEPLMWL